MKSGALVVLFCLVTTTSFSQGMFGFQAGIGRGTAYTPNKTLAVEGYYLYKVTPHFHMGASLFFQRYSFLNTLVKDTANLNYGEVLSIRQRSSYLFFCPILDIGFGYHKYVRAAISFGPGLYVGGNQYYNQFQPAWINTAGYSYGRDTVSYNTTYNIPQVLFRVGLGLSERIPTYRYWNITLSEEFTYLPRYISNGAPKLSTGYISFMVGIMHKYPQVFVEY